MDYTEYRKVAKKKLPRIRNAQRTTIDGQTFPSRLEAALYQTLQTRVKAGELKDFKRYSTVTFQGPDFDLSYKLDFIATHKDGHNIWVEAKGMDQEKWKWFKKVWKTRGPGELEIWKGKYDKKGCTPYLHERVTPPAASDSCKS